MLSLEKCGIVASDISLSDGYVTAVGTFNGHSVKVTSGDGLISIYSAVLLPSQLLAIARKMKVVASVPLFVNYQDRNCVELRFS